MRAVDYDKIWEMSAPPLPFAGLREKAAALLKKRPLEFLFLFAALAAASSAVSAYKANASTVLLEIAGQPAVLQAAKVYSVSSGGGVSEMEKPGPAWTLGGGKYPRKLLLALPAGGLPGITEVSVRIGKRSFSFAAADLNKLRPLRLGLVEKQEWDIYELPEFVKDSKSLFPNFKPVNWRGDAAFCIAWGFRVSLFCLFLLLVLAVLPPGSLQAPAGDRNVAPGAGSLLARLSSMNRTVWSSQSAAPARSLNLDRHYHLGFVFLLTVCVVGAISFLQVDPHHDGVMLKPAFDVADGQTLFRDTFTQYGALSTWVQALAVEVFGRRLLVLRLLTAFTYGLTALLMWLIYSRFLPNYLNTFTCVSWLFLGYFFLNYPSMFVMPWSTVFAVCSSLFSLYLLLRFLEGGGPRALFAAGFAAALTFWFKINYGGATFLASLMFLAILQFRGDRRRAAGVFAAFLGGYLAAHALFCAWLAAHGSFRDFVLQSIKFALAFAGNNTFTVREHPVLNVAKSLFQIGSVHGGLSYLWLALPLASAAVFLHTAWLYAVKKDPSAKTGALLAASSVSLGLWLGYYPIPALFHMYLSSALFFGPLSYLVLSAAGRLGFSGNRLLVLAVLTMMFLPDFAYRLRAFAVKLVWASTYERIETPEFLRGMYVPAGENKAFAELETLIRGAEGPLINLTNSGLFSLYRDGRPNFHKMYMDWGWNNSFLYPDYIPAVERQLLAGKGCVLSPDLFMVPGYIPVKVFPPFVEGVDFSSPVVLLLPGTRTRPLRFSAVDTVSRPRAFDNFPQGIRFRLKAAGPATIKSVAVKLISKDTVRARIPRYEFEYDLLPKTFDPAARELIKKRYLFDGESNQYIAAAPKDGKAGLELMDAFSGVFLYERNSFLADTFLGSEHPKVVVYRNGTPVTYGELFDGAGCKSGDSIDIIVPAATVPDSYVARLRVNYKGGTYQEEKITVFRK